MLGFLNLFTGILLRDSMKPQAKTKQIQDTKLSIQVNFYNNCIFGNFGNFTAFQHWRFLLRCYSLFYAALGVMVRG